MLDITYEISTVELDKVIKSLKPTLSSGGDDISNLMIKKLGSNFKKVICHFIATSIKSGITPKRWKLSIVRMIPKKSDARNNPTNYRPISSTSCLARLCERMLLINIKEHLKKIIS